MDSTSSTSAFTQVTPHSGAYRERTRSIAVTSCPASTNRFSRLLPTNPAAPVTATFIDDSPFGCVPAAQHRASATGQEPPTLLELVSLCEGVGRLDEHSHPRDL